MLLSGRGLLKMLTSKLTALHTGMSVENMLVMKIGLGWAGLARISADVSPIGVSRNYSARTRSARREVRRVRRELRILLRRLGEIGLGGRAAARARTDGRVQCGQSQFLFYRGNSRA